MIEIITKGETPSEAKIKSIAVDWILDTVKEKTAISLIKSMSGVVVRKRKPEKPLNNA